MHAAYKTMPHPCMDKALRSLDCNSLHKFGYQRLGVLLKLILAIAILLKKSLLTLPNYIRGSPDRAYQFP